MSAAEQAEKTPRRMPEKALRRALAVLYLTVTAGLVAAAVFLEKGMYDSVSAVANCFKAMRSLFIVGCVGMGVGVYSFRAYTRRHREYRADSLVWGLTGLALAVCWAVLFVQYGGAETVEDSETYLLRNILCLLSAAAPVPLYIRGLILSASGRTAGRRVLTAIALTEAAAVIALTAAGVYVRLMPYTA